MTRSKNSHPLLKRNFPTNDGGVYFPNNFPFKSNLMALPDWLYVSLSMMVASKKFYEMYIRIWLKTPSAPPRLESTTASTPSNSEPL